MKSEFGKDYDYIINRIRSMLISSGLSHTDPNEIVSEAYISINKNIYDRENFIKACNSLVREYKRKRHYTNTHHVDQDRICIDCKRLLNHSKFGIINVYRYGGSYLNPFCKECCQNRAKKYYSKYKETTGWYDNYLESKKNIKRNNRENLSDSYIRQLLSKKYSIGFLKERKNYYLIEEKRKEVYFKRKLREDHKNIGRQL